MSTPTVQSGPYRFFTKAELDQERLRYKEQVKSANTQLAGSSINGQSFTFNVGGREMSLAEWANALADAYQQLGITEYGAPESNRRSTAF